MRSIQSSCWVRLLVVLLLTTTWTLDIASSGYAGREAENGTPIKPSEKVRKGKAASKASVGEKVTPHQTELLDRCEAEAQMLYKPCMNKTGDDLEECLRKYDAAVNACVNPGPPPKGQESQNVYRIPYANGTNVKVGRDFVTHNPFGRIDMHGKGGGTHRIVAAADGFVRYIQDGRTKNQWPERLFRNTRDCLNNYVWIEHVNGEWAKYSHMEFGSTTITAKLKEDQWVAEGTYLGDEGKVGCASRDHLHFQIYKIGTNPEIDPNHGDFDYHINDEGERVKLDDPDHRNPRFRDLEGNIFTLKDGETYVAGGLPKCRKDTECPSGYYCNAGIDLDKNRCMPLKADNDTCDVAGGGHQCKSGFCKFGRCYTPHSISAGGTCYTDDACSVGKCSDVGGLKGVCVCKADADCIEGKYCDQGADLNLNQCKNKKADNESCDLVGGGHQCKSGFCKFSRCYTPNSVEMGDTCYNDDACQEGKCSAIDGAKGTCVCKKDSDCGTGKWCDAGIDTKVNACRPKRNKGESCAGVAGNDHKCKSGKCSGFPKYECK
jgi:hypothetical protein